MDVLRGCTLVGAQIWDDAVVEWESEHITYVGPPRPDDPKERQAGYILPGLIDLHCHGGGGESFPDATLISEVAGAAMHHRRNGTTVLSASAATMEFERMEFVLGLLAQACEADLIEGIEIEGPFLSRERSGSQNANYLLAPDIERAERLLEAAGGCAWAMAVAPELEGADALVEYLAQRGVLPAWAHTNANSTIARYMNDLACALLESHGKTSLGHPVVDHLFNAMREMNHRAPGPTVEYLAAARLNRVTVELIADGVHLSNELVRDVVEILGPDSIALITDAMAAAGMPDGTYELGGLLVHVTNGVARLRGGNLAGGTQCLIDIVRNVVACGVSLPTAVLMATRTPARVLGRTDVGELGEGMRADILLVSPELDVERVYRRGCLVE